MKECIVHLGGGRVGLHSELQSAFSNLPTMCTRENGEERWGGTPLWLEIATLATKDHCEIDSGQ